MLKIDARKTVRKSVMSHYTSLIPILSVYLNNDANINFISIYYRHYESFLFPIL